MTFVTYICSPNWIQWVKILPLNLEFDEPIQKGAPGCWLDRQRTDLLLPSSVHFYESDPDTFAAAWSPAILQKHG